MHKIAVEEQETKSNKTSQQTIKNFWNAQREKNSCVLAKTSIYVFFPLSPFIESLHMLLILVVFFNVWFNKPSFFMKIISQHNYCAIKHKNSSALLVCYSVLNVLGSERKEE